jgi:hypothetical protein
MQVGHPSAMPCASGELYLDAATVCWRCYYVQACLRRDCILAYIKRIKIDSDTHDLSVSGAAVRPKLHTKRFSRRCFVYGTPHLSPVFERLFLNTFRLTWMHKTYQFRVHPLAREQNVFPILRHLWKWNQYFFPANLKSNNPLWLSLLTAEIQTRSPPVRPKLHTRRFSRRCFVSGTPHLSPVFERLFLNTSRLTWMHKTYQFRVHPLAREQIVFPILRHLWKRNEYLFPTNLMHDIISARSLPCRLRNEYALGAFWGRLNINGRPSCRSQWYGEMMLGFMSRFHRLLFLCKHF